MEKKKLTETEQILKDFPKEDEMTEEVQQELENLKKLQIPERDNKIPNK